MSAKIWKFPEKDHFKILDDFVQLLITHIATGGISPSNKKNLFKPFSSEPLYCYIAIVPNILLYKIDIHYTYLLNVVFLK